MAYLHFYCPIYGAQSVTIFNNVNLLYIECKKAAWNAAFFAIWYIVYNYSILQIKYLDIEQNTSWCGTGYLLCNPFPFRIQYRQEAFRLVFNIGRRPCPWRGMIDRWPSQWELLIAPHVCSNLAYPHPTHPKPITHVQCWGVQGDGCNSSLYPVTHSDGEITIMKTTLTGCRRCIYPEK